MLIAKIETSWEGKRAVNPETGETLTPYFDFTDELEDFLERYHPQWGLNRSDHQNALALRPRLTQEDPMDDLTS